MKPPSRAIERQVGAERARQPVDQHVGARPGRRSGLDRSMAGGIRRGVGEQRA